jgi:hypothetical protein
MHMREIKSHLNVSIGIFGDLLQVPNEPRATNCSRDIKTASRSAHRCRGRGRNADQPVASTRGRYLFQAKRSQPSPLPRPLRKVSPSSPLHSISDGKAIRHFHAFRRKLVEHLAQRGSLAADERYIFNSDVTKPFDVRARLLRRQSTFQSCRLHETYWSGESQFRFEPP